MSMQTERFDFPPLGPTGEGEPVYPPGKTREDFSSGEHPLYWKDSDLWQYYVLYQLDRPACAFRCYYPEGSAPCDEQTARRFIEWAQGQAVTA